MSKRDEIMRLFGPKLIEALSLMVLAEINVLRSEAGLPPRTQQQLLDAVSNHVTTLPDYDWMDYEP